MTQRVADVLTSGVVAANAEYELAAKRFDYLVSRRDSLLDRVRFGTLALNGASIIAVLTILGGDGKTAGWIGFNSIAAKWSLVFFAVGTVLAGVSSWLEANRAREEPAQAFERLHFYGTLSSMYSLPGTDENQLKVLAEWEKCKKLPLVDFGYSHASIWTGTFGAASWLCGISIPVAHALGWR